MSCRDVGLFCNDVGLFCSDIGLFCNDAGLFCSNMGLFCIAIGLFGGDVESRFLRMSTRRDLSLNCFMVKGRLHSAYSLWKSGVTQTNKSYPS